jgi:hypothetical protein
MVSRNRVLVRLYRGFPLRDEEATCWWLKNRVEKGKLIEPSHTPMTARHAEYGSFVRPASARYMTTALSADKRPVVRMVVK